jgi:helicase
MVFHIEELVLNANGFEKFNPMQESAIKKGFEKSLVVSAPTASGKTIVAELFMLERVLNENKKVVYTCPLRALASEHYNDFKKKYSQQGSASKIRFALSTGDLDSSSSYLKSFDIILTTYEKLISLLRHKADWLSQVGGIIVDELHELDSDRGPVLEIALTQLRINNPNLKVLGLSATIPNSKELSEWLGAELVESNFRPTKLREGVLLEREVEYNDGSKENGSLEEVIENNLKNGKQLLVFLNSRKRAEQNAKKICEQTQMFVKGEESGVLKKISEKALNVLESPTEQCASLAETIKLGSAFHHAGLMNAQRELVEENFRNGKIKVLCSTTTLSAGINAPADVVIIPSLYRFEKYGMELISVRETKQMLGRSGRPKFSSEGRGIIVASSEAQKDLFIEKFINGKVEAIESKLSIIPILRTHVLALIATNYIYDIKSIEGFFEKTLYAHQFKNMGELLDNVLEIIEDLIEFGFVERKGDYFSATLLGKRVSDLFLDPNSAFELITALKAKKTFTSFSYLYSWVNCAEFSPWFRAPRGVHALVMEELSGRAIELPFKQEKVLFEPEAVDKFFSAMVLEEWIKEKKEQDLFKEFGLAPGVLFGKTLIIEWLAYATTELSKVLGQERHLVPAQKLAKRIKHGVKEELLLLVALKGIGRVRARKLFNAGIKRPSEVKNTPHIVEAILGKKVAEDVLRHLNPQKSVDSKVQSNLFKPQNES